MRDKFPDIVVVVVVVDMVGRNFVYSIILCAEFECVCLALTKI